MRSRRGIAARKKATASEKKPSGDVWGATQVVLDGRIQGGFGSQEAPCDGSVVDRGFRFRSQQIEGSTGCMLKAT